MRRLGLSFKSIGKKLGIDTSKDDVISVFDILKAESGSDHPPLSHIVPKAHFKQPPSPLWMLFDSEIEQITQNALPNGVDLLQLGPHHKVLSRLGDNAGCMLDAYLVVRKIISEEIHIAINNAPPGS